MDKKIIYTTMKFPYFKTKFFIFKLVVKSNANDEWNTTTTVFASKKILFQKPDPYQN